MKAPRHLSTVAVAASTALATALVVAGGPALAATVVGYAKNAGAVDGKKAVAANASVAQRKGRLVATGAKSGQLPNDIIARAPNSSKLQGVPLAGLASSYLDVHGFWMPTPTARPICTTPAFVPAVDSVAVIKVFSSARAGATATYAVIGPALSTDGGTTFQEMGGPAVASAAANSWASGSTDAVARLVKGHSYVFAALGGAAVTMNSSVCSTTVEVAPAIPGTRVIPSTAPMTVRTGVDGLLGRP